MDLTLTCPSCGAKRQSDSGTLIGLKGRVQCEGCDHFFDGYAHYRLSTTDGSYDAGLKSLAHSGGDQDSVGSTSANHLSPKKFLNGPVLEGAMMRQELQASSVRAVQTTNLFESLFAPIPKQRAGLKLINVFLVMSLATMLLISYQRDWITRVTNELFVTLGWCSSIECIDASVQDIGELLLVGSDLQAVEGSNEIFQFRAIIQNTGDKVVKAPAIELALKSNFGDLLSRRVIYPEEYFTNPTLTFTGYSEVNVGFSFFWKGPPATSFDSYVFYPSKDL